MRIQSCDCAGFDLLAFWLTMYSHRAFATKLKWADNNYLEMFFGF